MDSKLTPKERARFSACKKQIEEGLQICFDTGAALIEIRDFKLYREEFQTFEEFCETKYKIGKSYAYRLIGAAEVKEALKDSSVGKIVTNEAQARELSRVPEADRAKLLKSIVKSGEEPTAEAIREAAEKSPIGDKVQPMKSGKNEKLLLENDKTGYPIPETVQPLWDRAELELKKLLSKVSDARCEVRKIMDSGEDNPVWRRISSNSVMVALDNAYREINAGIPFAVCPYCQGQVTAKCTACKQTGYFGKFDWTTSVPKELIAIREKSSKK